jgi:5-methylcytosine-specific restriction enzyme A
MAEAEARRRNPPWTRDELILALDLYLGHRGHPPDQTHPDVIELSEVLNRIAQGLGMVGDDRLRNTNGVGMKLANFAAVDPEYVSGGRVGLQRGSRADKEVWDDFASDPTRCRQVADAIRAAVSDDDSVRQFARAENKDIAEAEEGRVLTVIHRRSERDRRIVEKKKQQVLRKTGGLAREAYGFDFSRTYWTRGDGFIECHHTQPLWPPKSRTTTGADLVLVCANCHWMIHAKRPWLTMEELRAIMKP